MRIGVVQEELEELVKKLDWKFIGILRIMNDEVTTHINEDENRNPRNPYLIFLSRSLVGLDPNWSFNFHFSATSYDRELNQRLYQEFQRKTGYELREPPKALEPIRHQLTTDFVQIIERKRIA